MTPMRPESTVGPAASATARAGDGGARVHYFELLPHEFRVRLAAYPVGYLPLGTIEWHGEQTALGADALIAQGLFERAARRLGGIVFPPLFLGPNRVQIAPDGTELQGVDYPPYTDPPRVLEGSCYWISYGLFIQLCEGVLQQAKRAGFKAIVADGHGPSRRTFTQFAEGWQDRFGLQLVVPLWNVEPWRSQIDHAARNETSLMMALHPGLVDLSQLPAARDEWPEGVHGEDPRDSSPAHGEECIAESLAALETTLRRLGY
jgi:creatinine amidohydrolase